MHVTHKSNEVKMGLISGVFPNWKRGDQFFKPPLHVLDNTQRAVNLLHCPYSLMDGYIYNPVPTDDPAVTHILIVQNCAIQESDPRFNRRVTLEIDDYRLTVILWSLRESDIGDDFPNWEDDYPDTAALFKDAPWHSL